MKKIRAFDGSQVVTHVVFRKWKDNGDILALFPQLPADHSGYFCSSYMHVGQHGPADYDHCIRKTKPCSDYEVQDLYRELVSLGYCLAIRHRAGKQDRNYRQKDAKGHNNDSD